MKEEGVDPSELPFEEETTQESEARLARRRTNQRRVILGAGAFILLGLAIQFVAPYLAPLAIHEGPMVQQPTQTSAIIVWTQNHDVPAALSLTRPDGSTERVAAAGSGDDRRVELTGLSAGTAYGYSISANGKELAAGTVTAAKPRGRPFSFVVLGDTGRATQSQFRIGARIAAQHPDFVVHTGDVVYPRGLRRDYYERFFQPYRALLREVPMWPSLGNHDVRDNGGAPFREVFDLPRNGPAGLTPENNYWFDFSDARFVVIDSNVPEATLHDVVAPWVRAVFAAPDAPRWRFAAFHHPPYTAGKYAKSVPETRTLVPAFEEAHIAIVFNGHDHLYERSKPLLDGKIVAPGAGVVYVVSGAGGADLYTFKTPQSQPAWLAAGRDDIHSYTTVTINGDSLKLVQTDVDGHLIDEAAWTR